MKRISKLLIVFLIIPAICLPCFPAYAASFSSWTEIREYVYQSNRALREYGIDDMDPSYVATPFTDPEYAAINAKAHELADGLTTDMEKARAIHTFVAEACYDDYDYYYHGTRPCPPTDPVTVFNEGVTVAAGYAGLLRVMLRAVGIPVRVVTGTAYSGYTLTTASLYVQLRESNHDWIEAYIDGAWRLCDPTWDSNNYFEYGEKHFNAAGDWYFCDDLADFSRSHFAVGYYDELRIGDFIVSVDVDEKTVCGAADGVTPTNVVIPEGTTRIGNDAFRDCTTLTSVSLPGTLTSIGSSAFSGCTSLTAVTGGENVTSVAADAFKGCGALTAITLPVDAEGNGKALQLTGSGEAANGAVALQCGLNTAGAAAVWYGGSAWRVIGYNGVGVASETDTATLLANGNMGLACFDDGSNGYVNKYDGSTLKARVDGIAAGFSAVEKSAISARTLKKGGYDGKNTDCIAGDADLADQLLWPLSTKEAYTLNETLRQADPEHPGWASSYWWLRSPGNYDRRAPIVDGGGDVIVGGGNVDDGEFGVRPAFRINLQSVLFISAAAGGKAGDGALTKIADYGGSEWKLTLPDDARVFAVTETQTAVPVGGTAALTYTGAEVGTNEYISAILTDAAGSAVYYGRLTQPDEADGTLTFTVPADLSVGSYTLKVFSEQYNGDHRTDCASAFDEVTLTVFPGNGKALQLTGSGDAANILGAQQSNVYFGNYKQSGNKATGFNVDPVKWRVLSNTAGKLFLLSDRNLDAMAYEAVMGSFTWETCSIRKWLNNYDGNPYEESFIGAAFSAGETAAIALTTVVNDDNPEYGTPGGNDTADRVFLLSIAEAKNTAYGFTDNDDVTDARVSANTAYVGSGEHSIGRMSPVGEADWWWLRTPGRSSDTSSVVAHNGYLPLDGNDGSRYSVAVRPALNVDLNKVLFTSAAVGGKTGDGALRQVADYSGSEWKLTLPDDARAFAVTETAATAVSGGSVTLTYTGAAVGTNEYVSAILTDGTGSAVYYGRLTQPDDADGTLTFTMPADLAEGSYTLKVFSEQYNGDNKTDYASACSDVALTVISELDAAKAAAKAELENFKNAINEDDYRDAQKAELAAAIRDGKAAIDAAADIDAVAAALENAEAVIDEIKTDVELTAEEKAADKAAAKAAEAKIAAIGTVKYDNASKQKIDEARKAYNALTADQKALVKNYKTLTAAEKKYADLKTEADKPVGQSDRPHGENCVCYDITGDSLAANVMRFICAFLCFVLAMRTALGV